MTTATGANQDRRFEVGWVVLFLSAGLMTLNQLGAMFYLGEPVLFLGWTVFNVYSLRVIAIPLDRQERWAWYATGSARPAWLLPRSCPPAWRSTTTPSPGRAF